MLSFKKEWVHTLLLKLGEYEFSVQAFAQVQQNKNTVNKILKPKYTYHKKNFKKNLSCVDQLLNTYATSHWWVKDIKENLY